MPDDWLWKVQRLVVGPSPHAHLRAVEIAAHGRHSGQPPRLLLIRLLDALRAAALAAMAMVVLPVAQVRALSPGPISALVASRS